MIIFWFKVSKSAFNVSNVSLGVVDNLALPPEAADQHVALWPAPALMDLVLSTLNPNI